MRSCVLLLIALAQLACDDGTRSSPAAIVILSPGSGQVFAIGADVNIAWEVRQEVALVRIELSRDGRLSWETLAAEVNAAAELYSWTAAGPASAKCHLRISDAQDQSRFAETGYSFEIAPPFLSVVSPNGNEKWGIGSVRNIRWNELGVSHVKIELSRNGGLTWEPTPLAAYADASGGSYAWTVAGPADVDCKVRISDADGGPLSDVSNGPFEIATPSLTLDGITGDGPPWEIQDTMVISWTAIGVDEVRIDISRDGGSWEPLTSAMPAYTGSFSWRVSPGTLGVPQDCRVRVVSVADDTLNDVSAQFRIRWDGVYRVKASAPPGGDGTTWETAFQHPQEATPYTSSGDDVWVAGGTYTSQGGDSVLDMDAYVSVYGGFSGSEYDFNSRRPDTTETKLDGQNTVYHVVKAASGARLDGFLVTGGYAGGFSGNDRNGGGMYVYAVSGVVVADCTFESNSASVNGGGMYCYSSSVTVTDCVFRSNTASQGGGAACENIYSFGENARFERCIFEENLATMASSFDGGGGLAYISAEGAVINCLFWKNTAYSGGGVLLDNWGGYYVDLMNCTLVGNSASYRGGGIHTYYGSYTTVTNSIAWGNTSGGIYYYASYPPFVTYSCTQNFVPGMGNIVSDPQFVDQLNGSLHLRAISPCVNTGTSLGAPSDDLDGQTRDGQPDMGCYEY